MSLPAVVAAVDELYRAAVMEPDRWNDVAVSDWAESVAASGEIDRRDLRSLRRVMRMALKLARFWASPDGERHTAESDWMTRVDIASGPPAWRPTLDLAANALDRTPDPELFAHVAERFRMVNNQPFAGGVGYEAWLEERRA